MHSELKKFLILGGVILLISGGLLAWRFGLVPEIGKFFAATPNGNIKYIGYYASRKPDSVQDFQINYYDKTTHSSVTQADENTGRYYTNLIMTGFNRDLALKDAQLARKYGSKLILDVTPCFYEPIDPSGAGSWRLRANWSDMWNNDTNFCAPLIREILQIAPIYTVFLLDEPYGHRLTILIWKSLLTRYIALSQA